MATTAPRRILVTGAAGFVGRHLLPALAAALPEAAIATPGFDVTDREASFAAIREWRPDACVHLAAIAAVPAARSDPQAAWRVNLGGTLNLAAALAAEAPGATLLFASSADAYGRSFRAGRVDEAAALDPMNTYGATKAAADLALGAMAGEGLRIIRARPFNHTGPGQSPAFVVAAFARQVARIEAGLQPPVLQTGALDPLRDFLDVRDVCACYARCLAEAHRIESGTVLNIASGLGRRVGDVLAELLELAGIEAEQAVDTTRLRPSDIAEATGDPARVHALLGWAPAIPWRQTLSDVLDDWRLRLRTE